MILGLEEGELFILSEIWYFDWWILSWFKIIDSICESFG